MEWDLGVCAIISDVHGNLNALNAVLDDLEKEHIDRIICLGDTVGYGVKPLECLDLIKQRADFTILGNHDSAAIFDPENFNDAAMMTAFWTRDQIEKSQRCVEYFEYLCELPVRKIIGDVQFVHGSARNPTNEYVFPDDIYEMRRMSLIYAKIGKVAFQGHTHVGGIFREVEQDIPEFTPADELINRSFKLAGTEKLMINCGSVGQPRDGNPKSCYAIVDGETCRYRRVDYDIASTSAEILKVHGTRFSGLATRLLEGR